MDEPQSRCDISITISIKSHVVSQNQTFDISIKSGPFCSLIWPKTAHSACLTDMEKQPTSVCCRVGKSKIHDNIVIISRLTWEKNSQNHKNNGVADC